MEFTGIDTLNLTFQKLRMSSLAAPSEGEEVDFGLTNQVFTNIQSEADLKGMELVIGSADPGGRSKGQILHRLQKLLPQHLR